MNDYGNLKEYTVREIGGVLRGLLGTYDIVQLVDVEECRVLDVQSDGTIHYGRECFRIWDRSMRCATCTGYQSCMTHSEKDKTEHVHGGKQVAHAIPIYLEMLDGEMKLCTLECVKLYDDDGVAGDGHDDDLGYISTHDVLTRLYTREKLYREIRSQLMRAPGERYLLVMGNVLNFQLINKLYGVDGGNRILVGIGDILRSQCTHEEVYGRYRDDRFLVLVRKDKFSERLFIDQLQRVCELISSPIYSIRAQLGVYEIEDADMPITNMIDHTELALKSIRDNTQVRVAWFEPGMLRRKLMDQHVIAEFERALSQGDFHIYLQPQVHQDGHIHGAEALVRWIRPDGTAVLPMEFLGVLHQSELLSHLDAYVWEQAVKTLAKWTGTPMERLYISVNVDPTDFYHLDVPKLLGELCHRYGVDTARLRVEITETALFDDVEKQSRIVETLHQAGFKVEIDDFGKGYSSLSLLKDIHADVLKIDMGFIRGKSNLRRSRIILESVIEMARNLNMAVITEGVETREQVDNLLELGCNDFQGFYFSRPLPVRDFEEVVRARE